MRNLPAMRASAEDKRQQQALSWQWLVLRVVGAGLLVATAAIHLDLYLTGYRTIPTIGWLFLLQVISAFGLGAIVLVSDSRLASAAGAGFALANSRWLSVVVADRPLRFPGGSHRCRNRGRRHRGGYFLGACCCCLEPTRPTPVRSAGDSRQ